MGILAVTRWPKQRTAFFDSDGRKLGTMWGERRDDGSIRFFFDFDRGVRIVREELLDRDLECLTKQPKSA